MLLFYPGYHTRLLFDNRLAQWSEYSPIAQEVVVSIPAQYKDLCAWTCLYWVWAFSMYIIHIFTKKVYKYVYLSDI
jgi:hypothetical protein